MRETPLSRCSAARVSTRGWVLRQLTVAIGRDDEHPHGVVGSDQMAATAADFPCRPIAGLRAQARQADLRMLVAKNPTTAAKSRKRSVSASVAFERREFGSLLRQSSRTNRNQIRSVLFDVGEETVLGRVGDVVVEGLGEELIGGGEVLFAVAEEDAGPAVEMRPAPPRPPRPSCRRRPHPRSAGPRVPGRRRRAWPRRQSLASRLLVQRRQLSVARPDGPGGGRRPSNPPLPQRFPEHLDGLDRLGQALQPEFAKRAALVAVAATGHQSHDVGSQDLAPFAGGTEPGRLDNGIAEVVAPPPW